MDVRLIDADAFLVEESEAFMAAQLKVKDEATRIVNEVVHKKVQMLIADAPTVDAVPVVRCKDCVYSKNGNCELGECYNIDYDPEFFCRDGYRGDEDVSE